MFRFIAHVDPSRFLNHVILTLLPQLRRHQQVAQLELPQRQFAWWAFPELANGERKFQQFCKRGNSVISYMFFFSKVNCIKRTWLICLNPRFYYMANSQLTLCHKMVLNDVHTLRTFRYLLRPPFHRDLRRILHHWGRLKNEQETVLILIKCNSFRIV